MLGVLVYVLCLIFSRQGLSLSWRLRVLNRKPASELPPSPSARVTGIRGSTWLFHRDARDSNAGLYMHRPPSVLKVLLLSTLVFLLTLLLFQKYVFYF